MPSATDSETVLVPRILRSHESGRTLADFVVHGPGPPAGRPEIDTREVFEGDVADQVIKGVNLYNTHFYTAAFRNVRFVDVYFHEVELTGCAFFGCSFHACEFVGGPFDSSLLVECDFDRCQGAEFSFERSSLRNVSFNDSLFDGTLVIDSSFSSVSATDTATVKGRGGRFVRSARTRALSAVLRDIGVSEEADE